MSTVYKIYDDSTTEGLAVKVNAALVEAWILQGGVSMGMKQWQEKRFLNTTDTGLLLYEPFIVNRPHYYQAMVKNS